MKVAMIGLGLIGGSFLRALAASGHTVTGYDRDPATRALARAAAAQATRDARWRVQTSVSAAVAGADLAVVATPLTAVAAVLDELAAAGFAGLVTDVVSVKTPVRDLVATRPGLRYVGGHPMAGTENAGFAATDPALFAGCAWVLCLDEGTALADWLTVARLVTDLGTRVVPATADDHDRAVAAISHVPHLLALALAGAVADPLAATLAAGSFRDGTRVALSRPELVAAMCGGNAGPVLHALDTVLAQLTQARAALAAAQPIAALRHWATPGHAARVGWPASPGAPIQVAATAKALRALGDGGGSVTAVSADGRTVTAVKPAPPH